MKASGRRILFTLAATVHVGRGALEPCHAPENDALQYNATYQAAICANQTLFTPATTKLPEGTYIALGLKGARELADYLDVHPDVKITNLLISDSTVGDLAIDFGYQDTYIDFFNDLHTRLDRETQLEYNAINRNVSRDLQQTILDLDALSSRIMNKVAPSLETFAYLNYITTWGEYWRLEIPDDNRTRNVLDRDFPRLTHLTLRDRRWRFQTLEGRSTFFPPLPALTHLHILTGNHVPALSVIRQAVPNATHVLFTANYPAEFSAKPMFLVRWTQSLMRILVGRKVPLCSPLPLQPDHNPMLRRGQECGNPGVEYHYELRRLAHNRELHLRLPPEEDFDQYGITYEGYTVFPLIRAIAEFEDRLGGGEGEWGIPSKNETVKYEL